jgi:hypothetical protein
MVTLPRIHRKKVYESNLGSIYNEDVAKKIIQMNIPANFKKQIQNKKEKKELISKQNNIVKQILSPPIHIPNNNNINQVKKVPVKLIKKEETPCGSNFNINNININGNIISKEKDKQKMKEVNNKINEFDMRLNNQVNHKENNIFNKPLTPDVNRKKVMIHNKRPSSGIESKHINISQFKEPNSDKEECILENVDKYFAKNDKLLDKPKIKKIEKTPMVIPKRDSAGLKSTLGFMKDEKNSTNFFKDVLKEEDYKNIVNYDKYDINHFVNDLNKKSQIFDKRVSILSDFVKKDKEKEIDNLSFIINKDNNKTTKKEDHDTVPLYNNIKDNSLNFQVYQQDLDEENKVDRTSQSYSNALNSIGAFISPNQIINTSHTNSNRILDYHKSTEINSDHVNSDESGCVNYEEENSQENISDEEEVEAVENVSVVKSVRLPEQTSKTNKEERELLEYKEKFENKIKFYKEESKKSSGDADFEKIFKYYMEISEVR